MNSWEELKVAVGQWASANFGSQNGLGCLVPLMGIGEEVGEFETADFAGNHEAMQDAIGDVLIFLMDYCYRAGVDLTSITTDWIADWNHNISLSEAVGALYHTQVKRLQRIRGMEDDDLFREKRTCSVAGIIVACAQASPRGMSPLAIASNVFVEVVQKRKWHDAIDKPLTVASCTEDFQRVVKEINNL